MMLNRAKEDMENLQFLQLGIKHHIVNNPDLPPEEVERLTEKRRKIKLQMKDKLAERDMLENLQNKITAKEYCEKIGQDYSKKIEAPEF